MPGFGSSIMKLYTAIGLTGSVIYIISLFVIWRSYIILNYAERIIAKSINRVLSTKFRKYLVLLLVCLVVGIIAVNRYSHYIYVGFFLLCAVGQAYQYGQLKNSFLNVDLPKSYTSNILNSNRFLVGGLALIVVSFLFKSF